MLTPGVVPALARQNANALFSSMWEELRRVLPSNSLPPCYINDSDGVNAAATIIEIGVIFLRYGKLLEHLGSVTARREG